MNIEKHLKSHGKKITPERIKLFSKMKWMHIFDSKDLVEAFPEIGRASIFRTLKLFIEIWILRRVSLWESGENYEVECCEKHHHEHMKCNSCGDVISFESNNICKKLFVEAKKIGFQISEHSIWIFGTCKKCHQ